MSHRIRTTHAGSLPRPRALVEAFATLSRDRDVDVGALAELVSASVVDVVQRQVDAGIDIANDGEQGRESFFTYVQHRMSGFQPGAATSRVFQDMADHPEFLDMLRSRGSGGRAVSLSRPPQAVAPVAYGDTGAIDGEIAQLTSAAAEAGVAELFMTAPSPGIIAAAMANRYYADEHDYLAAVSAAIAVEYRRIVEAGLLLQIDAPDLAMECHGLYRDRPQAEFIDFVGRVVDAINSALAGLPPERVRLHVCWGNYDGPHTRDVPLAALLDHLYRADVGGLVLSGANPRHAHEYREFEARPLPENWTLSAGVIDTTTNYVEHPEVVADRLERIVAVVGDAARVVACTDCGFDTAAGFRDVAPDVAWAKLHALREGADLASSRL